MRQLLPADREFLALVSSAAFANPFGLERYHLDAKLAECPPDTPDIVALVVARVGDHLRRSKARDRRPVLEGSLNEFAPDDAQLLEDALLFESFHRFAEPFDDLLAREVGATSAQPFPEHRTIGAHLVARGFAEARVPRALELFWQLRRAWRFLRESLPGASASARRLREDLWDALFTKDVRRYERHLWNRMEDFSLLLLGPTGTGKGAAARALGRSAFVAFGKDRFVRAHESQHVAISLAELHEGLVESELFGHEKGAFTGAIARHEGVLARCPAHGVLFLDEIGEVSLPTQTKLLRVLQERTFTPVGSHHVARFEGRVVAATHRDLRALRAEGRFRDDFWYRLSSHTIRLASLRERLDEDPNELTILVATLVRRIVGDASRELEGTVLEALSRDVPAGYAWRGNVRELEQAIRRVLLTGRCEVEAATESSSAHDPFAAARAGELDADGLVRAYCAHLFARHGSYVEVARRTGLDRRTVAKHVRNASEG
ncbi:MAG: sigma 54-interacting transcriptional regulator [Myxococcota bacterium]|jgi:transcriptional regulator of acetoin/glycerol metabolism|nr:sigma 54-interacting transcriptional regulator [Myxococcota bacterium]